MGGSSCGRACAACPAAPVPAHPPSRWPVLAPPGSALGPLRYAARSSVPLAPPPSLRRPGFRRGSLSAAWAARRRVSPAPCGGRRWPVQPPASPSAVWRSLWPGCGGGSPLGGLAWWLLRSGAPAPPQTAAGWGSRPAAVWSGLPFPAPIAPSVLPPYSSRTPVFRRRASSRRRRLA